jgi:hypothetical protein
MINEKNAEKKESVQVDGTFDWRDRYDEIDNAPDRYITIRREPYKVMKDWFDRDRAYYNKSIEGLWFDAYTWRVFRQTRLTSTPLLLLSDVGNKVYYVDNSVGKFRWGI